MTRDSSSSMRTAILRQARRMVSNVALRQSERPGEQRYVFTEDPLPFEGLKAADAEIKLTAKRLLLPNSLALTDLDATLSLQAGKLVLKY